MSDSYIDPWETQPYGLFAREQMKDVCLGMVEKLDPMVQFAIHAQADADRAMKHELDRQPARATVGGDPTAEASDAIVRFGSYLNSIKGRPVSPVVFFGNDAPSVAARRRLTKLTSLVGGIVEKLPDYKTQLRDHAAWLEEFSALHTRLKDWSHSQRTSRVEAALLRPDLAAARESWLAVYTANKALITGLLRHAKKLELLPLIFDDLAETHRAQGVSDTAPTDATAGAKPEPAATA